MKKLGTRREMIIRSFRPPRKLSKSGFSPSFSATIRPGKSLSFLDFQRLKSLKQGLRVKQGVLDR